MKKQPKLDFDMMDEPIYLTTDDVHMRLDASIVRFNGVPYVAYSDGFYLTLFTLENKDTSTIAHKHVSFKDKRLDITAIDIGYANLDGFSGAFYITRTPVRKQKQGSCSTNLLIASAGKPGFVPAAQEHLLNIGVFRALTGKYPTLKEALTTLSSIQTSVGLSPNFAVVKEKEGTKLYFDQQDVGTIIPDSSTEQGFSVKLKPTFHDSIMSVKLSQLNIGVY